MRITMPDVKSPICQCGEKAEVYLYPYDLRIKCIYCGKKVSVHYTSGFYRFIISDLSDLVALIGGDTDE
jgi:hypothetical protein